VRTAVVLLPVPRDAAALAHLADLAATLGDDRRPLVLAEPPEAAAKSTPRCTLLISLPLHRYREPSPEGAIGRRLAKLPPGGVLAIDAWTAPEALPETLRAVARCVFPLATPPTACVVFAPPAAGFHVAGQLAGAFRLRTAGTAPFRRDVAQALAAARWLRWLGPAGLAVHRLIARNSSLVRRLLTG
jgi:hypothetical protein